MGERRVRNISCFLSSHSMGEMPEGQRGRGGFPEQLYTSLYKLSAGSSENFYKNTLFLVESSFCYY
jgi:hypothetical protein